MIKWPKREDDDISYEYESKSFVDIDPVDDHASTIPNSNTVGYIMEEPPLTGIPMPLKQTMTLRCTAGEHAGRTFTLSDEDTIGRAPECCIRLSSPYAARLHCRVGTTNNKWYICCPGSNGMSINGVRAQRDASWHILNVHDKLTIIDSEFVRID